MMVVREVKNHGQSGYRGGCRCEACRAGHRKAVGEWRAAKRGTAAKPVKRVEEPLREPLSSAPAFDLAAPAGAVERALEADLGGLVGEPPWKGTLSALALYNARLLDQLPTLDRLDLVSSVQLRTLEVLNRLRAVSEAGSPADAAERFLADLGNPD